MSTTNAPLINHLNELRKRCIFCTVTVLITSSVSFGLYQHLASFFTAPFLTMLPSEASINVNSIYEGFFVKIKLSIICGIILSLPILLFQTCRFITPGLKNTEKKWLFIAIFFSSILSITSTYMGYVVIFPYIIKFLTASSFIPNNVNILLNFKQNISYIITFLFGSIIVFQSPIILMVLLAKQLIKRSFLIKNTRWFIVGIVIASAIITPPDIISQLCLSVPLIICYFGCILFAKIMNWGND